MRARISGGKTLVGRECFKVNVPMVHEKSKGLIGVDANQKGRKIPLSVYRPQNPPSDREKFRSVVPVLLIIILGTYLDISCEVLRYLPWIRKPT